MASASAANVENMASGARFCSDDTVNKSWAVAELESSNAIPSMNAGRKVLFTVSNARVVFWFAMLGHYMCQVGKNRRNDNIRHIRNEGFGRVAATEF